MTFCHSAHTYVGGGIWLPSVPLFCDIGLSPSCSACVFKTLESVKKLSKSIDSFRGLFVLCFVKQEIAFVERNLCTLGFELYAFGDGSCDGFNVLEFGMERLDDKQLL